MIKVTRFGVCKCCGKKFKEVDEEFFSVKQFWKPDICPKCKEKNENKTKNNI
jgi:hypothetical protein